MFALFTSLVSNLFLWLWLAAAVALYLGTRDRRRARVVAAVALALVWLVATRPVAEATISPLERQYATPDTAAVAARGVKQVVVLTGGGYANSSDTLSASFPHASAYRLLGGLELAARLGPDCRLIFSGSAGRGNTDIATALVMQTYARQLQPDREILAEAASNSTGDHPGNVRPFVGDAPFALVTSASHMPRAMWVFRHAGLDPVAYPVDRLALGGYGALDAVPSVDNLWTEQAALREYLAFAFYRLRGA
jgi:uncharacterized SAM-binding protein YcdF (DUF218 family)